MTKERLKTALLISLFMVSIFLANQIWIELPDSFFPSFGDGLHDTATKKHFYDIVSPEQYLVNINADKHTVLYLDEEYELWEKGRSLLVNILESQNYEMKIINNDDISSYRESLSLDYFFSEKIHVYILSKALEVDIPNSISDEISEVKDIHINLGKEPFIVFSDGDVHLEIKTLEKTSKLDEEINNMRKTINIISENIDNRGLTRFNKVEDMFPGIDNQRYIPFKMTYNLPNIYVESEIDVENEDADTMAKYFFNNLDYVRPFTEANGATIYIYDQEVLKIHQDGMVEYSNLNDEVVINRELYKSLNTAVNFVTNHLGWPENAYLKSIESIEFEDSRGYRFGFMYKISGAQIMLNKEDSMEAPIEIEVFNDYVKSYKRFVRLPSSQINSNLENDGMRSPWEILNDGDNYNYIKSEYIKRNNLSKEDVSEDQIKTDILSSLDEIYLAYTKTTTITISNDLQLLLKPVWVIEIDGIIFMFDVYEGTPVE